MKRYIAAALTLLLAVSVLACTPSAKKEDASSADIPTSQSPAEEEPAAEQGGSGAEAQGQPDQTTAPEETDRKRLTFSFTTLQGDPIDESYLASHKVTMVNFWATWCGYCVREMPDLEAIFNEYDSADFGILGVLTWDNDVDGATKFLSDNGITYPVINAEGIFVDMSNEFSGLPTTLFLDEEGNVLSLVVGAKSGDDWRAIINLLLEQQR